MVGLRSVTLNPLKVQELVMPKLKDLMSVRLKEEDPEYGSFFKISYVLLKIGVFDENHATACNDLFLNLQLVNFL